MAQMVNCDCESFGIYRINKCFIYQSSSLHCDFAKFWTLRLNYTMLQNEVKLSGFLSKYAKHGQYCNSVCLHASARRWHEPNSISR